MFRSTKTSQIVMVLTTIVSSITVLTSSVPVTVAAQEQQYSFITKWGSEGIGFGKFRQPLEIAIDSDNDLYVTDTTSVSNQIQKFAHLSYLGES
jgi:biopolymer transport protein ExbD